MMHAMADDLGTRIRRARERKGWTQEQLRDALPLRPDGKPMASLRSIGNWERNETVPRNVIGALEDVLGVDLDADPDEVEFYAALVRLRENPLTRRLDLDGLQRSFEDLKRRHAGRERVAYRAS